LGSCNHRHSGRRRAGRRSNLRCPSVGASVVDRRRFPAANLTASSKPRRHPDRPPKEFVDHTVADAVLSRADLDFSASPGAQRYVTNDALDRSDVTPHRPRGSAMARASCSWHAGRRISALAERHSRGRHSFHECWASRPEPASAPRTPLRRSRPWRVAPSGCRAPCARFPQAA
jgi:hypothetical protein